MYRQLLIVGLLLAVTAGMLALGDTGGLSKRMPTQVPPRRTWKPLVLLAALLVVVGAVGMAVG